MRRLLFTILACAFLVAGMGAGAPAAPAACCGMAMSEGCPCPPPKAPESSCQATAPGLAAVRSPEASADEAPEALPRQRFPEAALVAREPRITAPAEARAPDPHRRQALLRCWRT